MLTNGQVYFNHEMPSLDKYSDPSFYKVDVHKSLSILSSVPSQYSRPSKTQLCDSLQDPQGLLHLLAGGLGHFELRQHTSSR